MKVRFTVWKVSKYGVFSGPSGKYEPEKSPYLDTFHPLVIFRDKEYLNFRTNGLSVSVSDECNSWNSRGKFVS